jgi:hypothetical protein
MVGKKKTLPTRHNVILFQLFKYLCLKECAPGWCGGNGFKTHTLLSVNRSANNLTLWLYSEEHVGRTRSTNFAGLKKAFLMGILGVF